MNILNELQKEGVYKAIFERRDIREFNSAPLPMEKVHDILLAGHHGPSVGFMQPWNFIIIKSGEIKTRLAKICQKEVEALAIHYEDEKRTKFLSLKVEGIKAAPVSICVTCDPTRGGGHVLGRNSIPETDILSVACCIQNMWLAAYAEGIAMGWVSFYKKHDVREILGIPPHIDPVALLSLGYTDNYPDSPILEKAKWEKRLEMNSLLRHDTWDKTVHSLS